MSTTIRTYTGVEFPLRGPWQDYHINIVDIAHALSQTCRFGGHTEPFYSVADHCCNLVDYLIDESGELRIAQPFLHTIQTALLHDAAEAYLGDVVAPLKGLLPYYAELERPLLDRILSRFGVCHSDSQRRRIDLDFISVEEAKILQAEMLVLMPRVDYADAVAAMPDRVDSKFILVSPTPREARERFMQCYSDIFLDGISLRPRLNKESTV